LHHADFGRINVTTAEAVRPHARTRAVLVGLMLALSVLVVPTRAHADPSDDAGAAAALVNQARADYGVGPLSPDRELQILANRQANRMAQAGYVFHTGDLGGQLSWGWWAWGENVGYGGSIDWVHSAFMASWEHSANILDPSYNYVGVGVAYGSDGMVYVAEVFGAW